MPSCKASVLAAALLLASCTSAQDVPLAVQSCSIAIEDGAARLHARVTNESAASMLRATLRVDVYQNYRFERAAVAAEFTPALDPGTARELSLPLDLPGVAAGAASCVATSASN
ncbi:MAG TPA: hypothetical protein VMA98_04485 [Candidatus Acidoferrales bacterium]|nr:hypothetical protein [Candidatus Acidoferrales bacterium]